MLKHQGNMQAGEEVQGTRLTRNASVVKALWNALRGRHK